MKKAETISLCIGCIWLAIPIISSSCKTATTPVSQLTDCQRHQTGILRVTNNSALKLDINIIIDGTSQGILAFGVTKDYALGAGTHSLEFAYATLQQDACDIIYPIIVECQTTSVACNG